MLDDGLFELFPTDYAFGLHNFHDLPSGHFAVKPGVMMASFDCFEIVITGRAAHAFGQRRIVAAAQWVTALQIIVASRGTPGLDN